MRETLYGHHAVLEALRAGRRQVYQLLLATGSKERGAVAEILHLAAARKVKVKRAERDELRNLGDNLGRESVVAQVSAYPYVDLQDILQAAFKDESLPLLLLLDCLQDPQNLGTLLRTAEAVGVHGVVIPIHRAAGITPAVSNASAGAVEHLRIAQVTNLAQIIATLKEKGIWVVGLERAPEARPYDSVDLNVALALVVGSEGRGLGRLVRKRCDLLIHLPMRGRVGSLNASVAGSIALYLAWQQRFSARGAPDGSPSLSPVQLAY